MTDNSGIDWTDATINPIRAKNKATGKIGWYCEHASDGCRFCYAEGMNHRLGTGIDFARQNRDRVELFLDPKMLTQPLRWKKPRTIFWNSMTDMFADFMLDEWIDAQFAVMALTPQHRHIVLTKRPDRIRSHLFGGRGLYERVIEAARPLRDAMPSLNSIPIDTFDSGVWHRNIWIGTSVEMQREADERRPHIESLARERGWNTWVSYEPALGLVDWTSWEFIKWLVSGGESGPKARPAHPDWHRAARDFCAANGIPYFFKQHGNWKPVAPIYFDANDYTDAIMSAKESRTEIVARNGSLWGSEHVQPPYDSWLVENIGKKAAGHLLDGREWRQFPDQPHA